MENRQIGKSVPRKEGREKVTGTARYVDDLTFPGMIHGVTVRSSIARGKIVGIRFGEGIPWNEFTIVTAKDIPGKNCVALLIEDQPCLADQFVNHPEEAILLLAHPDKYLLEEARRAVHIEIEALPAVFTMEDSLARKYVIWGDDNIFKSYRVEKGDVASAWSGADFIVEGEYETGAQEQLYIEPQGMIARASSADGVTVWGSLQCPYYVHKALVRLFGLPKCKVRVVQTETGGGFGGKEEYPSMIAGHAALLASKSGKPVKMIYDRAEDMAATTKRHPSRTRHRTAITREGKLLAMEIDFTLDGGAYETLSPVVLSRGTIHAGGPYACPNVLIQSRVVATNAPPHGAFRGFGAPQSVFALERHLDRVAAVVGLLPEELRRRNFIHEGQTLSVGQVIHEKVQMDKLLERALELSGYQEKRARFAQENPRNAIKRGIESVRTVPGRFETVEEGQPFTVIVDYAHTPDALANVLRAARGLASGRLICVFGAGGDRDREKRPQMGRIVSELADRAIVTSDNPRGEEPQAIVDAILEGVSGEVEVELDRAAAIAHAVEGAREGDVVVIAGKGHEQGQQFADRTLPFDDRDTARDALRKARA